MDMAAIRNNRTDGAGERSDRLTLLLTLLTESVRGRVSLIEMGARMWQMLHALVPGMIWEVVGADLETVRGLSGRSWTPDGRGDGVEFEDVLRIGEVIRGGEVNLKGLGRRVTLLAYILVREVDAVTDALPNTETIGKLWGLKAANKRSAVVAALMKVQADLDKSEMRQRDHATSQFWYQKKRETRMIYAALSSGNCNRLGPTDEDEDEEAAKEALKEVVDGVPVRAEYRGMKQRDLRRRLDEMHRKHEIERLNKL